jgi:hypothetical protein
MVETTQKGNRMLINLMEKSMKPTWLWRSALKHRINP